MARNEGNTNSELVPAIRDSNRRGGIPREKVVRQQSEFASSAYSRRAIGS